MKAFLEYLTNTEKKKAAEQGQTNLRPTGKEEKIVKKKKEILPFLKEWVNNNRKKVLGDRIYKNKIVDPIFRMVMTDSGKFYTCGAETFIHIQLIAEMMNDGVIVPDKDIFDDWESSIPQDFIALTGNAKNKKLYLSISYGDEIFDQIVENHAIVKPFIPHFKKIGYTFTYKMDETGDSDI